MSKEDRAEARAKRNEIEARKRIGNWQQRVSSKYRDNYDEIFGKKPRGVIKPR